MPEVPRQVERSVDLTKGTARHSNVLRQQGQRVLAVLQRQLHLPAKTLGLEDGQDHLRGPAGFVHAARGLAVLFDRGNQVLDGQQVAAVQAAVFQRLVVADAFGGDVLPRCAAAAGSIPGLTVK